MDTIEDMISGGDLFEIYSSDTYHTIRCRDFHMACLVTVLAGHGYFGVRAAYSEDALDPLHINEKFTKNPKEVQAYISQNRLEMALALQSVLPGLAVDREILENIGAIIPKEMFDLWLSTYIKRFDKKHIDILDNFRDVSYPLITGTLTF